ncbi:MAG: virulence factor SrfB [SAR324 cluster bacterium]|nr:virulence factor SrfB [SAR324 cluster bacterium]
MREISLIGNSGIQFVDLKIDLNKDAIKKEQSEFYFEYVKESGDIFFIIPEYDDQQNCYVDKLKPKKIIPEHKIETYKATQAIRAFEGKWIPLPYFRVGTYSDDFQPGPLTWSRMWITPILDPKEGEGTHHVVLAFDTKCYTEDEEREAQQYLAPTKRDTAHTRFEVNDLLDPEHALVQHDWIQEWLGSCIINHEPSDQEKIDKELGIFMDHESDTPEEVLGIHRTFISIILYLTLLRIMKKNGAFPTLYLDGDNPQEIEVDLVLDIGNSRSCGLLLETSRPQQPFSFSHSSQLELRDLSQPNHIYSNAFEMHCEFAEVSFGGENVRKSGRSKSFFWPSVVRVGPEAKRLAIINGNTDYTTGISSPKRYLWDTEKRPEPWYFNQFFSKEPKTVLNEYTAYFNEEGSLVSKAGGTPAFKACYPRGTIMRFALSEIIFHAITQANSYRFRNHHGQAHLRRKLKRIVLTCPTAMLLTEKQRLREFAKDAAEALKVEEILGTEVIDENIQIVPDPAHIDPRKLQTLLQDGRINPNQFDWGYDEATCGQLVFLYGEVHDRFKDNAELYFKTVGKKRSDSQFSGQPTVTIASLDIGGGTTDLMICDYQKAPDSNTAVIFPRPRFWEGFNLAGDDILKNIIERIVMPGIRLKVQECGCAASAAAEMMNALFGPDYGAISATDRVRRKQFASQVAVPIGLGMIQHAVDSQPPKIRLFDSFFGVNFPQPRFDLLESLEKYFQGKGATGFSFSEVSWVVRLEDVNAVVRSVVNKVLGILSGIIQQYHCDYLVLAGRPSMLPVIREMLLQYLPLPPDKIISLGNYRIGNWYPFAHVNGLIRDPKTTVCVGAAIGLMSGKMGRLEGFKLVIDKLRDEIKSTANYIGVFDPLNNVIKNIIFNPESTSVEYRFHMPIQIGMRQMKSDNWIASPMFKLDYSNKQDAQELSYHAPFDMTLSRSRLNPELLDIHPKNIQPVNDTALKPRSDQFSIKLQTLENEEGYWLDTGSFLLSKF